MYKIDFNLEPLTYMVHFQMEDEDATIRASELKPMLDKYLTQVLRHQNKLDDYKNAIIEVEGDDSGYEHFDYQVRIKDDDSRRKFLPIDLDNEKEFFFFDNKTKKPKFSRVITYPHIEFVSENLNIIRLIKKYFKYFIAVTFFGFRKGKGYGRFKIRDVKETRDLLIKNYLESLDKKINVHYKLFEINCNRPISSNNKYSQISEIINDKNIALKSGVLRGYFSTVVSTPQWTKEILKEQPVTTVDADDYRFYRVLLGFASQYGDYNLITNELIDRFENPIKYYVAYDFKKIICFIDKEIIQQMLYKLKDDPVFKFDQVKNGKSILTSLPGPYKIKAPSKDEFDLDKFLNYIVQNLPNASVVNNQRNTNQRNTNEKHVSMVQSQNKGESLREKLKNKAKNGNYK